MTEKQKNIINAALELFAKEGFNSTSTSKVAKKAGVSEGLIFRHFKNKDGLLDAILQEGEIRAIELFSAILSEQDSKEVLRKAIKIGLTIENDEKACEFWKLQFKIKWELEIYHENKMEALKNKLTEAFTDLRYKNPEDEASLLLITIDGLAARFFLQKEFDLETHTQFLLSKYGL